MTINTDPRPPADVLMDSLASVEKADKVVIILECDDALLVKTNCTYREMKWILDQATFAMMSELFSEEK
jgi:hypothetical protein